MSNQQERPTQTPNGYVPIQTEDGECYLVPPFMVPATHQALDAYRMKAKMKVNSAKVGVSLLQFFLKVPIMLMGSDRWYWAMTVANADADADADADAGRFNSIPFLISTDWS